ncbi:MAG: protease modulator HflC [Xanthobacteraceae bacterium]|nr:protease modulator HflC [Xanthobacteraceae bacterium]QYK44247.1 MAG: protease modulator HflC [Xanthobacteraceae bacterium]
MRTATGVLAVVVAIIVIAIYSSIFFVHQSQQALVLRFGEPIREIKDAGLNFKLPFVDAVVLIDKLILDLDNKPEEVIASDQKRLVVDAFARYRIVQPLKFYQSVGTVAGANSRLLPILNASMRSVLGEATFIEVVKDERAVLMGRIKDSMNAQAVENFGIEIVDMRLRRADLPDANSQAIYQRMQTERQREAAEIRAQGNQAAQAIRAKADRDVTIIIAEATSRSEELRGLGDGERNKIFADAFGRDPEFFAFYRSMQAYELGLQKDRTRMLLSPESEFFRFFANPGGNPPPAPAQR